MSEFLNALIIPRQRRRHVQAELERLTPAQAEHILQVVRDLGEKN